MLVSWFVIVNPTAGNGNFSKQWKLIQQNLKKNNITYSFAVTKHSKHEIELVKNAIQHGFRNIISVGGDGTLHHVVNGVMRQRYVKTSNITVAVIPIGTGNDWVKTYKVSKNIVDAVETIGLNKTILQDIGYLQLKNTSVYFNNVAGIGYDGYIINKLNTLKQFGAVAYLLSGIAGLLFYKKTILNVELDTKSIKSKCLMTLFGIGKYSGGGMQLTDYTSSSNGLFDVTMAKNLNLFDLMFNFLNLYNGKISRHKKIENFTSKTVKVTPYSSKKTYIQADGELIGTGAVKVSLISKAIQFVVTKKS